MILVLVQAVLVIAAGVGLFRLWRLAAPSQPWLRYVAAAGFLGRALLGQALFWISWLRLPVARSMQLGDGLWSFANDAVVYRAFASSGARHGLWAIITFLRIAPSVTYIQTLSLTFWLFGLVTSAGLLLNLFCFLGMIAVLVHWPVRTDAARSAAAIVIAAISLSPAFVLWSLQPLKDTLFQFLVVAFVAACAWWQRAWSAPDCAAARLGIGALLAFLVYGLAGIRWYFAFALLIAASLFLFLNAFRTAARMSVAFSAALILTIVFCRVLVAAAEPYMPPQLVAAMTPSTALGTIRQLPVALLGGVDSARDGFQRAGGRTAIVIPETASAAAPLPIAVVAKPASVPTAPPPLEAHRRTPRPAAQPSAQPSARPATPPAPQPSAQPAAQSKSRGSRLLSGLAAAILPRTIGEPMGLFHIAGGRGMLWFTELDTLIFDVSVVLAAAAVAMRFRASLRNPLVWFIFVLTVLVGGPLVYSITNYGTLFRLREMIFLGLLFTPLAVATAIDRGAICRSD
jgi:hypothetical protein